MPELRTVDPDDDGIRLDRWFKRHYPHVTHVLLEKLLRKGEIRLDGKRAKAADRILAGAVIAMPGIRRIRTANSWGVISSAA